MSKQPTLLTVETDDTGEYVVLKMKIPTVVCGVCGKAHRWRVLENLEPQAVEVGDGGFKVLGPLFGWPGPGWRTIYDVDRAGPCGAPSVVACPDCAKPMIEAEQKAEECKDKASRSIWARVVLKESGDLQPQVSPCPFSIR